MHRKKRRKSYERGVRLCVTLIGEINRRYASCFFHVPLDVWARHNHSCSFFMKIKMTHHSTHRDREPIAMTAKSLHDPIVQQNRPRHRMCGCCWPAAQAADCWEIVNAYGVCDMVGLQLGLLRKMLTSQQFATRREAATGLREGCGRAQRLETVRMV